jgi:hypothetical protein
MKIKDQGAREGGTEQNNSKWINGKANRKCKNTVRSNSGRQQIAESWENYDWILISR